MDLGGNNYAQGGRKKVEQAGEKQVTKKLVECVLVAQRQTLTNSRINLDSISASLLLPPPPTHGRLKKSSSRMKARITLLYAVRPLRLQ
jgi:hypothetical protein